MLTRKLLAFLFVAPLPALLLLCVGCGGESKLADEQNPYYMSGIQLREKSEYRQAAAAFEKCLRLNPASAKAHLQLGTLYDDHFDDPLVALYHYRQYLEKRPEGEDAPMVKRWQAAVEDRIFERLGAGRPPPPAPAPPEPPSEAVSSREKMLIARSNSQSAEIRELRRQVQELTLLVSQQAARHASGQPAPAASVSPAPGNAAVAPAAAPANAGGPHAVYEVKPGDSLSKISARVYGSSRHWPKLRDANSDILGERQILVPGMKLRIPEMAAQAPVQTTPGTEE